MANERNTQDLPGVGKAVVSASSAGDAFFSSAKSFTKQLAEIEKRWQEEQKALEEQMLREQISSASVIQSSKIPYK